MKTCTIEGCSRQHLARGFCAPHYSTWHRAQSKYTITCGWCAETVQVDRPGRTYCSYLCAMSDINGKQVEYRKTRLLPIPYTGPPWRPPVVCTKGPGCFTSGQCIICSAWFVSEYRDITCSPGCRAKHRLERIHAKGHRRGARKRNAYVADVRRLDIYERDRWICHLCNKRISKKLKSPHPMAASIDHVIPLARGGTHEPANVRAAHRICNSIKSDHGGGEQLMLIG